MSPVRPHLGATCQDEVAGLADEHAAVLHQLLAVQEGEAPEEVPDLPLAALPPVKSRGGAGELSPGKKVGGQVPER